MNSHGSAFNRAKKVTIIIEDEGGFEYRLNFGGEGERKLNVQSALNQEFAYSGNAMCPMYQHPTKQEFNLKIGY